MSNELLLKKKGEHSEYFHTNYKYYFFLYTKILFLTFVIIHILELLLLYLLGNFPTSYLIWTIVYIFIFTWIINRKFRLFSFMVSEQLFIMNKVKTAISTVTFDASEEVTNHAMKKDPYYVTSSNGPYLTIHKSNYQRLLGCVMTDNVTISLLLQKIEKRKKLQISEGIKCCCIWIPFTPGIIQQESIPKLNKFLQWYWRKSSISTWPPTSPL